MSMPVTLGELLSESSLPKTLAGLPVGDLRIDSRKVQSGDVFVCVGGEQYIPDAIKAGAAAILFDDAKGSSASSVTNEQGTPVIKIKALAEKNAELAARRYPVNLPIIGVTGTNGKSTLVSLIAQFMQRAGSEKVATIGTLGIGVWGEPYIDTGMTTPDIFTNYAYLSAFEEQGVTCAAMEISSHGLMQDRVKDLSINTAVFTNLTQDHLDYHGSFADYRAAKRRLFTMPSVKAAVVNADDENADVMIDGSDHLNVLRFGINASADVMASNLRALSNGMAFDLKTPWGSAAVQSPLLGVFNVYNLLAALCVAALHGIHFSRMLEVIPSIEAIAGRMECLESVAGIQVVVDFAHTPDALEQALKAVKAHTVGRIWVVFGCGGDRDQQKRALMGAVADEIADQIIITSDNPRSESPERIIEMIASGCKKNVYRVADRKEAIGFAIAQAQAGDTVLIAGKGHETVQIIGNKKTPFSDVQVALEFLALRDKSKGVVNHAT